MANWSAADWAGIIGACAWVPIIFSAVMKFLQKPKLDIILHREAEIGYNTVGPIFNLGVALSARNAECLVNDVKINIKGPNQESYTFTWNWFEERFYSIDYAEIGPTPVTKKQDAVAIKVLKEGISEKKIGYHENSFKSSYDQLLRSTDETFDNIANSGQNVESLKITNEYNALKTLLTNSMFWKQGSYSARMEVCVLKVEKPFIADFEFKITALDIRRLEINVSKNMEALEMHYFSNEIKTLEFNWINPKVNQIR